jgi:hypothetical protein
VPKSVHHPVALPPTNRDGGGPDSPGCVDSPPRAHGSASPRGSHHWRRPERTAAPAPAVAITGGGPTHTAPHDSFQIEGSSSGGTLLALSIRRRSLHNRDRQRLRTLHLAGGVARLPRYLSRSRSRHQLSLFFSRYASLSGCLICHMMDSDSIGIFKH